MTVSCHVFEPEAKGVDAMPKSLKRGVAFNFQNTEDLPLLSPYISWDYNWGNTANDNAALWFDTNEMDYCPMCWNGSYNADKIREYVKAHPKTQYLLAFNEPNLTDQARMTPQEAAAIWQPVVALAKELNLKLVSPAMNYGTLSGYSDPEKWLDEFFAQPEVSISDIYAISIHCYMASPGGVKSFVEKFYKYDKPIWLTEFCAWDPVPGSVETQMSYMSNVLNYLETNDKVERYAWFIPRYTKSKEPYMQLITGYDPSELTDLGKMYAYFSTFDKSCYLNTNRYIHAGEYAAVSDNAIQVRANTDDFLKNNARKDGLKVVNMTPGQAVTYQLNVTTPSSGKGISVRYSCYSDCILAVYVDDNMQNYLNLPRTGDANVWQEAFAFLDGINISKGMHTLKLELYSGSCNISGFEIMGTDD